MALEGKSAPSAEQPKGKAKVTGTFTGTKRSFSSPEADPIGAALRRLHDEVSAEPLPEEFLKLIAEIDRKIERKDKP